MIVSLGVFSQSTHKNEIINIDNEKIIKERQDLEDKIEDEKERLCELQYEYEREKEKIQQIKESAQSEYDLKIENLKSKHLLKLKEFQDEQVVIENNISILKRELESLKNTKASIVQAFQKEEALKKEKDNYRLDVSQTDLEDIKILQSIQYKLSNQRILSMLIWQTFYAPIAKRKFPIIIGEDKVCGIYKITNSLNEKVYIGQAKDIKKRLTQHMKAGLGIDCPASNKLYEAMREDGLENFLFEVLEKCEPECLNEKESYYIEVYNSVNWGYNTIAGNKTGEK